MADRPITEALPADLPEDWAADQIVSPNGVEAGLDARHGYNYQSRQINAAQRGVNALNAALPGKADRSVLAEGVIGTAWTGSGPPYAQTLSVAGVGTESVVEVFLPASATAEQVKQYQALNLQDGGQAEGRITLRAFGTKNTANVPVTIIVRGDA